MTLPFNFIPNELRLPCVMIEVDGSNAGLGGDLPAVLLIGQKFATGTAVAGELTQITGDADIVAKAGAGSMLHTQFTAFRATNSTFDVFALPLNDLPAGVAAASTLTVNTAATKDGVLSLYVAGDLISVGVTAGMTTAQIAAAIAAAVLAAGTAVPVTATALNNIVTLTARHKGTCGNSIDVRLNLYGESTPTSLGLSLTAFAGGAGDPALPDLSIAIGTKWINYVAMGINNDAAMAALHLESRRRYQPPVQQGFRAFAAFRGDAAAATAYGSSKNYEHISCAALGVNPTTPWEAAATICGAASMSLRNNPVLPMEGIALPNVIATSYFDFTTANSLLYKGMSVLQVDKAGNCFIKRLISMYQTRPDGTADDAFLDINTAETMERIRYEQRIEAVKRFVGTAAAKSDEGYRAGLRITTIDSVKAMLLGLYKNTLQYELGWVQNYDYYKKTLVVEQDPKNPSRFNYTDDPVILSPFAMLAGRAQFLKRAPN